MQEQVQGLDLVQGDRPSMHPPLAPIPTPTCSTSAVVT
jgi:hypothetical protein